MFSLLVSKFTLSFFLKTVFNLKYLNNVTMSYARQKVIQFAVILYREIHQIMTREKLRPAYLLFLLMVNSDSLTLTCRQRHLLDSVNLNQLVNLIKELKTHMMKEKQSSTSLRLQSSCWGCRYDYWTSRGKKIWIFQ